jgi:hypothetical protein
MKRTITVFALALAFSAIAFAHGNEKHVMGAVTRFPTTPLPSKPHPRRRSP